MLPLTKILCPTDFSEPSYEALDKACELAAHFDAELILLHVVPLSPPFPSDLLVVAVDSVESDAARQGRAAEQLRAVEQQRIPQGVRVRTEVKIGYAANEIVCAAEDDGADLIVIATHGLTGWRHMVFGSIAEKVVQTARCPVLTVHGSPGRTRAEAASRGGERHV